MPKTQEQIMQEYSISVVRHCTFVRIAGQWIGGIPDQQLNAHDLSKHSEEEAPAYADWFFGTKSDPDVFDRAWLHHQNHNPHHWEYWIARSTHTSNPDREITNCLPMPEVYIREMVADWHGAGRQFNGHWDISAWFNSHRCGIDLHPNTWNLLYDVLKQIGYEVDYAGDLKAGPEFMPPTA